MGLTADQLRCVTTLDRAVVVAAGAGSGKTFTLTERIVRALQEGYLSDIDEVCAITFTKKAAGELKSRIKAGLVACGLSDQALKADDAWVSTIHGMCSRILKAHALELGIDPAFTVIGDVEVQAYRNRAIDAVLVAAQSGERSPGLDALFGEYPVRSFGFGGSSVAGMLDDLVGKASANERGADAFVMPGVTLGPGPALAEALDVAGRLLEAAESLKPSATSQAWRQAAERFADEARAALESGAPSYADALAIASHMKFNGRIGSRDFRALMAESRQLFQTYVMEMNLGAARSHLDVLVGLAREALDAYRALKRADGVLDNDDLLVLAARALEEHPSIAARYTDKFKLIMIDEFQDTGQMEVDMVKRFAGEGACRLCTVGDAQQSIYRFRSADVSVYRRHLESVRAGDPDAVIELAANFRSHRDVLAFVDCVFEKPDMFGKGFMSLGAGRDESRVAQPFGGELPRITVLHTSFPHRGVASEQVVEASARRIARAFAELKAHGHSAGEMVVLLGRMKNSGVFAQALRDEGLPCVIAGGSVFSQTPEAATVRSLVRALANPGETQALFNVLTSPMFGLTADDVLKAGKLAGFVRHACRETGEGAAGAGFSLPLQSACAVMGKAWRAVGCEPVSSVVNGVVIDSGWMSRMQAGGPEGLASAANVCKAVRMIEEVERGAAHGPVSLMEAFEAKLESAKEAPGALSVSGSDSVRIMTVHASKGLEFPIVAVAEFKDNKPPSDCLLATSVNGAVYVSLGLKRTLSDLGLSVSADALGAMGDYVLGERGDEGDAAAMVCQDAGALHRRLAIREHIAVGDSEEANRLLYVALTRAKEALVVSTAGMCTKDNPEGIPKSALAGVARGLDPTGAAFGGGSTMVDYGGSAPALVEAVHLGPESAQDAPAGDSQPAGEPRAFMVPEFDRGLQPLPREPYQPMRDGVFSYSSIADAAHAGDAPSRLAASFSVSVDEAGSGDGYGEAALAASAPSFPAVTFDPDGYSDFDVSAAFDEDRATDLGTAFHRLAQYAVVTRGGGGLAMPPAHRIEALSRSCRLDSAQRQRLDVALRRWFGSAVARDMASLPELSAEVPFFIEVEGKYLEGEIDLLGFGEGRACAYVVDYKTGGQAGETADDLRRKHVLQASCYAYAILKQGVREVEAAFVRVERPRADDPDEPQCVRYRFTAADIPVLAGAIAGLA